MVAIGHTAVGVIVGVTAYQFVGQGDLITGLLVTGTAGVVSHYIGDFIPHGHFVRPDKLKKALASIIIFDLLLPIILLLGLVYLKEGFNPRLLYIMFGIGGTQLPDVLDGLIFTGFIKNKGLIKAENDFHQGLHWHGTGAKTLLLGARDIWQVLLIAVALITLIF